MSDPLTPAPAASVVEVIQRMQAIDAALTDGDGLKWFNFLYRSVTESVQAQLATGAIFFADPLWIDRLDVGFANLYFAAVRAMTAGNVEFPHAWRPLLMHRAKPRVARIQFALAGMNAHINRDLVVALLDIYRADGGAPSDGSPRQQDFALVNQLLEQVEAQVRGTLLVGTPLEHGGQLAGLENIIANWSVGAARQSAWNHSQSLWQLRGFPSLQQASLDALDGLTEFAGNGLVLPVLP